MAALTRRGGREGRGDWAACQGKWSPRGARTTDLSLPNSQPLSVAVRRCARVTGKAGENGQNSGDGAARSPWRRPSAPACGDASKALASSCLIKGGDQGNLALGGHRLNHRPVVLPWRQRNAQSGLHKGGLQQFSH